MIIKLFTFSISFQIFVFCLFDLLLTQRDVLNFLTMILGLSVFCCSSINVCFMYFEAK